MIGGRIAGPLVETARVRLAFVWGIPGLRFKDEPSRAIARALITTLLGRLRKEEREWIARIEDRRRELAASKAEISRPVCLRSPSPTPVTRQPGFVRYGPGGRTVIEAVGGSSSWAGVSPTWGRFMLRLLRELAPDSCLELGTAYGLSSCYQAAALELNRRGRLTTVDGAPERVRIAERGFRQLALERVEARVGSLPQVLEAELERIGRVDYAFVDAQHRKEATLDIFRALLPRLAPLAVIVFDDIRWSPGMWQAWKEVRSHPTVGTAVDLRRMGICVVSNGRAG